MGLGVEAGMGGSWGLFVLLLTAVHTARCRCSLYSCTHSKAAWEHTPRATAAARCSNHTRSTHARYTHTCAHLSSELERGLAVVNARGPLKHLVVFDVG